MYDDERWRKYVKISFCVSFLTFKYRMWYNINIGIKGGMKMAQSLKFIVTDPVGLYAAPATELVDSVKQIYSRVTLRYENKEVNLKSMMGVLSLGIPSKASLEIIIDGEDEKRALKLIIDKINELGISNIDPIE